MTTRLQDVPNIGDGGPDASVDAMMDMVWRYTRRLTIQFIVYVALAVSIIKTDARIWLALDIDSPAVTTLLAIGMVVAGVTIWMLANARQLRLRLLREALRRPMPDKLA